MHPPLLGFLIQNAVPLTGSFEGMEKLSKNTIWQEILYSVLPWEDPLLVSYVR